MFYVTLPFAVILLGLAIFAARREPRPIRWGWFFLGGLLATGLGASPVVIQLYVALAVALVVWALVRHRLRVFLPLAALAVAIPYGLVIWDAREREARLEQIREKFPFESMANRVPEPLSQHRTPLAPDAAANLDAIEKSEEWRADSLRTFRLRALHHRTVRTFVQNPGFGSMRVNPSLMSEESLRRDGREDTPVQPGKPVIWGDQELFEPASPSARGTFGAMHREGLLDFVNPWGWGYVESRDRVMGFLPHRFSHVPKADTWRVQRIELVGLLKHAEPVVYLSERLPAMAEVNSAPTRYPDEFEKAGLKVIQKGDDGFAAQRGRVVRFVGAIRSVQQCVDCHGGERGDLLGAFSYVLRPETSRAAKE